MNKAQQIILNAQKYNNSSDLLKDVYRISSNDKFDAFIIAPSWLPEKILKNYDATITCLLKHSYFSSYVVEFANLKLAWIQCAAGANNLIDACLTLANSVVDKVIFIGAVGALKKELNLGDIVTPSECLAYEGGSLYLYDELDASNFGKTIVPHNQRFINKVIKEAEKVKINIQQKRVFCTDSIICEYSHLDKIKELDADVIEMETASFYKCMEMMQKNGIAILCVSDNSATNISLAARTKEETKIFHKAREMNIPEIIKLICRN